MTLNNLIKTVLSSNDHDWNKLNCWGAFSGPSFKYNFNFENTDSSLFKVDSHDTILVYKEDVSITIGYGLSSNNDFKADWANKFPDPRASSHFIDIFYNNSLAFRDLFLMVDGGRCKLPIPNPFNGKLIVGKDYFEFVRKIDKISKGHDNNLEFDYYFEQTGIEIMGNEWIL